MSATPSTLDPALLLSALHPDGAIYCVCAFGSGLTSFRHPRSVADGIGIARELDSVSGHAGVYHCVGNLGAVPTKGRGRETDMVSAHAVWADVDALDYDPLVDYVATASLRGAKAKDAKDRKSVV